MYIFFNHRAITFKIKDIPPAIYIYEGLDGKQIREYWGESTELRAK